MLTAESTVIRPQSGPQEKALATPADIAIIGGAAGGGKTWTLLLEALRHHQNPDFGVVIFRRTYPQIKNEGGLWDQSLKLYGALNALPKESSLEWVFAGGGKLKFAHLQHEQDKLAWKGAQVALLMFDQLEDFTEGQFWFLQSRNRSVSGIAPYTRATCNPVPAEDHIGGWLHRLVSWWLNDDGSPNQARAGLLRWFVRDEDTLYWADDQKALLKKFPKLRPKSLTFIPSTLMDNPALLEADPGYLATLQSLPFVERKRLLEGNWKVRAAAGLVFNRAWFAIVDLAPGDCLRVRYWDKAGTEGGGARTAGVRLAWHRPSGIFFVEDVILGQWSAYEREKTIRQTALLDGPGVAIWLEQEPGSGGKESAEATIRSLVGFTVRAHRPTGSKLERAYPFAAQAEAGNVKLVKGVWNVAFLNELHAFEPSADYKDQVDAAAGAFNRLAEAPPMLELMEAREAPAPVLEPGESDPAIAEAIKHGGLYWPGGA